MLKAAKVADNTLIMFLGDNYTSGLHKQPDLWESGLRGRKMKVYENGIRVPMLINGLISIPKVQLEQGETVLLEIRKNI